MEAERIKGAGEDRLGGWDAGKLGSEEAGMLRSGSNVQGGQGTGLMLS